MGRQQWGVCAGFIAAVFACLYVSWPALRGPFLFDDFPNLQHLSLLQGHLDRNSVLQYLSQFAGFSGRPLSFLSFLLNDSAWPSEPWSFKYTNLLLHILNGVLIFGLARAIAAIGAPRYRADLVALFTMAAWLLHPMQLSTSMLVIQRMTQLSALFSFAALWMYVSQLKNRRSPASVAGAITSLGAGTVLAFLCKENGALVPLLAVVLNFTVLRERLATLPVTTKRAVHFFTIAPIALVLVGISLRWDSLTNYAIRDFGMGNRLLTEGRVLWDYFYRISIPSLRGTGIYHDDFVISRGLLTPSSTLLAAVGITVAFAAAIHFRKRYPIAAFGVLWFLAGHILESTVFPLEIYFEHRNYLPMFGPILASMIAITRLSIRKPLAILLPLTWIAYCLFLTWVQAPVWGDRRLLVTTWALEHPASSRANQQYADYLYRSGQWKEAAHVLVDAYARGVRGSDIPAQVLLIACQHASPQVANATKANLESSLKLGEYNNALFTTLRQLRLAVQSNTCPEIFDETDWLQATQWVLVNPRYSAEGSRAYIHVERAYLYRDQRLLEPTMRELEKAYLLSPSVKLSQLIASVLISAGLEDEAVTWLERGLEASPKGIRGLLSVDAEKSQRMINSIRKPRLD